MFLLHVNIAVHIGIFTCFVFRNEQHTHLDLSIAQGEIILFKNVCTILSICLGGNVRCKDKTVSDHHPSLFFPVLLIPPQPLLKKMDEFAYYKNQAFCTAQLQPIRLPQCFL